MTLATRTELPIEAGTGYRPEHTLPVRVELVRQLSAAGPR